MVKLANRVMVSTATTGTGTVTLGGAVSGFQTFASGGISNGDVVRYVITEGSAWEIGSGTYTSAGTTLSRTPSESSIGGGAITLAGAAVVMIDATAADFVAGQTWHPGYVAGNWNTLPGCVAGTASVQAANTIRAVPFYLPQTITISDLGTYISIAAASKNVQLAIYAADATTKLPTGSALAVTGSISTTSSGSASADITGADVQLAAAQYWAMSNSDGTPQIRGVGNTNPTPGMVGSATKTDISQSGTASAFSLSYSQTFGTWPSLTGASPTYVNTAGPLLEWKVASVP